MKGMDIKQTTCFLNFQELKSAVHSKPCISKKKNTPHYHKPIFVLNVLVYIIEMKKRCKIFFE